MFMVMYAPGGIASLIMMNVRVAAFGKLRGLLGSYVGLGAALLVALAGAAALIEMTYLLQMDSGHGRWPAFPGRDTECALHAKLGGCCAGVFGWIGFVYCCAAPFFTKMECRARGH
jgi:branched-chain amino acid transport system permease protein